MKFSQAWLKSLFNQPLLLSNEELCHQLTQLGLEVESSSKIAPDFSHVIIGEVLEAMQHPDADRLRVCQVSTGGSVLLSIVCGAKNARAGIKVCVAMIGAVLPGDFKIKESKLRGQLSQGMLCSADELGLPGGEDGIIELPSDAPLGIDIRKYLDLDDYQIEINLTPNRADCLNIYGIAREVALLNQLNLPPLWIPEISYHARERRNSVQIKAPTAAPLYILQKISNINNHAKTPLWMTRNLERSGIRSISLIVDILNYVMLLTGQPMHAFDCAKIDGNFIVERSKGGETTILLNTQKVTLNPNTLVIRDQSKILALAGIMGSDNSAVDENTTTIAVEAAFFNPLSMAGQARSYGLHTDASHRFERGVDPNFTENALKLAISLILELAGGEADNPQIFTDKAAMPQKVLIPLHYAKVTRLLGIEIDPDFIQATLIALQCRIASATPAILEVEPPSFRMDLQIEEDLIEEIARIYGYNNIPSALLSGNIQTHFEPERFLPPHSLTNLLINYGFQEVITYTFIDPDWQRRFTAAPQYQLKNAISPELSSMRQSLTASLLKTLQYNVNRQQDEIRIFEIGPRFVGHPPIEEAVIAGALTGKAMDFFQLKGMIENLYEMAGVSCICHSVDSPEFMHPGQTAYTPHGFFGKIHPKFAEKADLPRNTFVFELNLDFLQAGQLGSFQPISKFPQIQRDLAFIVNRKLPAGDMIQAIQAIPCEFLQAVKLFDVYEGPNVAADQKSLAFSLILQHPDRTLVDDEVAAYSDKVIQKLARQFQAALR